MIVTIQIPDDVAHWAINCEPQRTEANLPTYHAQMRQVPMTDKFGRSLGYVWGHGWASTLDEALAIAHGAMLNKFLEVLTKANETPTYHTPKLGTPVSYPVKLPSNLDFDLDL